MIDLSTFWICFASLAVACTVVELVRPARRISYKAALPLDLVAFGAYQLIIFPLAVEATEPLYPYLHLPRDLFEDAIPLPIRVVLFYLAADLGSYVLHRLMHTRPLWRFHRWHHSPTTLYWLAGMRATLPQQILFNLPYVVFVPLLAGAPAWVFVAIVIEGMIRNNWMHVNVAWRSNWLELILVTPRYHHIHHSVDAAHHDANYGALFTIWDRLFGSYRDPDRIAPTRFGTGGDKTHPIRMLIGY